MSKHITTGIYGGSFNPIHNGHTHLGRTLCQQGLVDELWFMVSPHNPHKCHDDLLDDEARLQLARLAVTEDAALHVCDLEFRLPRPSYMIHTLQHLTDSHPEREFILVIGADNWERFPLWYQHEAILERHRIIIFPRPGYQVDNLPYNAVLASTPLLPISSTDIRNKMRQRNYSGQDLAPAVWDEIQLKGYYR